MSCGKLRQLIRTLMWPLRFWRGGRCKVWRRCGVCQYTVVGSLSGLSFFVFSTSLVKNSKSLKQLKDRFWFASLSGGLGNSVILSNDVGKISQLNTWLLPHLQSSVRSYWKLCFRATNHGWSSQTFHSYCDNKGPTVTIVRVGSYIFGGYNDHSWQCKSAKLEDTNKEGCDCLKLWPLTK